MFDSYFYSRLSNCTDMNAALKAHMMKVVYIITYVVTSNCESFSMFKY